MMVRGGKSSNHEIETEGPNKGKSIYLLLGGEFSAYYRGRLVILIFFNPRCKDNMHARAEPPSANKCRLAELPSELRAKIASFIHPTAKRHLSNTNSV